ncbi:MAG TPA: uroporphyrinogen decarboxylase [Gemmatimonadales bacterium]|nr:uroporphyrinogen decarboxylase [Gemmatimonadales bacterium]
MTRPLLLRAIAGEPVERPPVWMMRQAGRYLPEYRAIRERASFLEMVRTPDLAAEVTIQPVERLGVDAAIIFSDILVIPEALGMGLVVEEGTGPRFPSPLASPADAARLRPFDPSSVGYVYRAIEETRRRLAGRVPVIGFAGGPWTLLAYMIEGHGTRQFARARRCLVEEPEFARRMLATLADAVARHLMEQVRAGAEMVQVFESWAGIVSPQDYEAFVLPALAAVVDQVREAGVPVVVFTPGAGAQLARTRSVVKPDVLGIDWQTSIQAARNVVRNTAVAVQGNLDPCALYAEPDEIERRTREMLRQFEGVPYVANLGHGILPDVPPEHAQVFVQTVQQWHRAAPRVVARA